MVTSCHVSSRYYSSLPSAERLFDALGEDRLKSTDGWLEEANDKLIDNSSPSKRIEWGGEDCQEFVESSGDDSQASKVSIDRNGHSSSETVELEGQKENDPWDCLNYAVPEKSSETAYQTDKEWENMLLHFIGSLQRNLEPATFEQNDVLLMPPPPKSPPRILNGTTTGLWGLPMPRHEALRCADMLNMDYETC